MIGHLDKAVRLLVLIISKMSGYLKRSNVKEGNNELMYLRKDNQKLLEKYKAIWTNIKDF